MAKVRCSAVSGGGSISPTEANYHTYGTQGVYYTTTIDVTKKYIVVGVVQRPSVDAIFFVYYLNNGVLTLIRRTDNYINAEITNTTTLKCNPYYANGRIAVDLVQLD